MEEQEQNNQANKNLFNNEKKYEYTIKLNIFENNVNNGNNVTIKQNKGI